MTINITTVVEALIGLLAAIVTAVIIPYIKSKTSDGQREQIVQWVKIAVTAAEQIYTGSGRGAEKKAYVLEWLKERGILVDDTAVDNAVDAIVESVVYEMNKEGD